MSKLQSKEHIEIEVKMNELDLTDAEKKAAYQEIKETAITEALKRYGMI